MIDAEAERERQQKELTEALDKLKNELKEYKEYAEAERGEHARLIDGHKTEIENLRNIIKQLESTAVVEPGVTVQDGAAEVTEPVPGTRPDAATPYKTETGAENEESRTLYAGQEEDFEEQGPITEAAIAAEPGTEETAGKIRCKICRRNCRKWGCVFNALHSMPRITRQRVFPPS